jgi:hypothetical protein
MIVDDDYDYDYDYYDDEEDLSELNDDVRVWDLLCGL